MNLIKFLLTVKLLDIKIDDEVKGVIVSKFIVKTHMITWLRPYFMREKNVKFKDISNTLTNNEYRKLDVEKQNNYFLEG